MDDVGADIVEETLVVGHDEQGLLILLQVVIQPDDGVEVKVVCRLVKHQQSGFNEKGAGQRYSHPPTTRKLVCCSVLNFVCQI